MLRGLINPFFSSVQQTTEFNSVFEGWKAKEIKITQGIKVSQSDHALGKYIITRSKRLNYDCAGSSLFQAMKNQRKWVGTGREEPLFSRILT